MSLASMLRALNGAIERWLTASPVAHPSQSLGIFRIVYALFYLWHLSSQRAGLLAGLPAGSRERMVLVDWFPFATAPPIVFHAIESILVAAIVLLLFGWRTHIMTAVVLFVGAILEALFSVADKENGTVFLTFLIPFFMLLARSPWGEVYALDGLRPRIGRGAAKPDASDLSARCALPVRAVLVMLSVLFFSAGLAKMFSPGIWLRDFTLMSNFGLYHNVEGALLGIRLNPFAAQLKEHAILHVPMQFSALVFEATFFLAMFDRRLLRLYVGMAMIFQSVNGLLFVVTFAPLLIAYGPFVDWERIRQRIAPRATMRLHPTAGAWLAWSAAVVLAATWNLGTFTRSILSVGGVIDWRSIFWPILPLGIWMVVSAVWQIARALTVRPRAVPVTPPVVASR